MKIIGTTARFSKNFSKMKIRVLFVYKLGGIILADIGTHDEVY